MWRGTTDVGNRRVQEAKLRGLQGCNLHFNDLNQREKFELFWLPYLVLMNKFELVIPWWLEHNVFIHLTRVYYLHQVRLHLGVGPFGSPK